MGKTTAQLIWLHGVLKMANWQFTDLNIMKLQVPGFLKLFFRHRGLFLYRFV